MKSIHEAHLQRFWMVGPIERRNDRNRWMSMLSKMPSLTLSVCEYRLNQLKLCLNKNGFFPTKILNICSFGDKVPQKYICVHAMISLAKTKKLETRILNVFNRHNGFISIKYIH